MINKNYLNLNENYLFSQISKNVKKYKEENLNLSIISLGIGDVTRPLVPEIVEAFREASHEMGQKETFRGYGDEQGYLFLIEEICKYYEKKNITLNSSEVFISDGAKSDLGNILDIFDVNKVLIPNPVYPVYLDTNIMLGRDIHFSVGNIENNFLGMPSEEKFELIYLCSPNNPTGSVYNREQLKAWVDYANRNNSIILFDGAYEAFITEDLPRSIYEIEGSFTCSIEICSFSKTAGFTGVRCGYTIVPNELKRDETSINQMWRRRQTTKFNGVGYIVQKAASKIFSNGELIDSIKENINYYLNNAKIIKNFLDSKNIWNAGGDNSPYIWFKIPEYFNDSWDFFETLLKNCQIVGTPGIGFGEAGEKFFRFTAFCSKEDAEQAVKRMEKFFK